MLPAARFPEQNTNHCELPPPGYFCMLKTSEGLGQEFPTRDSATGHDLKQGLRSRKAPKWQGL